MARESSGAKTLTHKDNARVRGLDRRCSTQPHAGKHTHPCIEQMHGTGCGSDPAEVDSVMQRSASVERQHNTRHALAATAEAARA